MVRVYPKPSLIAPWPHINPRRLLPVFPAPESLQQPALPSPPRRSVLDSYTLTTHLIPSAYLRSTPDVPLPALPSHGLGKDERKNAMSSLRDELSAIRDRVSEQGQNDGYPKVLWNCLNRYVRNGNKQHEPGLTLFFAHANGFHKEIWEPTMQHLLSSSWSEKVDEVWTWDAIQHGDSALVNADSLGGMFDWIDNTRDTLNFLLHFIPASVSAVLPTHLPRVPDSETNERMRHGFRNRTLIAIGHSFGGCTSAFAALIYPQLFSSIILVDPVIVRPKLYEDNRDPYLFNLALGALLRRDSWESREAAKKAMLQNPFFEAWDPAVLNVYVECGLYTDAFGVVRLKMTGIQEAISFLEANTPHEVWQRIADLDEKVSLHWIVPGKLWTTRFGGPSDSQEQVWRRAINASNVIIPNAGHLIPHEAPKECAAAIREFIDNKYFRTRANL